MKRIALIPLLLAPVVLGFLSFSSDFAASIESETVQLRYQIRGQLEAPKDVVLVAADKTSSDQFFPGWRGEALPFAPFPSRVVWADTIRRLDRAGAKAVVLAFYFSSISPGSSPEDRALTSSIRRSGVPVTVGLDCNTKTATGGRKGASSAKRTLLRSGATVGSLCIYSDEVAKQIPLRVFVNGLGPESGDEGLAVALARALSLPVPDSAFRVPEDASDTETEEFAWIDFSRSPRAVRSLSLVRVVRDMPLNRLRQEVEGKVVVVGDTDYDPSFKPLGTLSAGDGRLYDGEIHALGVATMLAGFPIREVPEWFGIVGLFFFGLTLPLVSLTLPLRYGALVGVGLLVLLTVGAQAAFVQGWIIPLVPFLLTLLAATFVAFLIGTLRSRQEISSLRERFADMDEAAVETVLTGTVKAGRPSTEQMVPGYRIDALIGRGASGNVYRATRLETGELVALKVVRPVLADDQDALSQFEREFQAARLIEHPNIVRILDEGTVKIVYAASEFLPLGDLQQLVERQGPLDLEEVLDVGDDIASALEAAHAAGLIHRDIKPSNLFRTDGGYKLGDFGVARLTGESTASAGAVGTIAYAAPEQLGVGGEKIGPQTDVYGLAATLFALLTGEPPLRRASIEESIAAKMDPDSLEMPGEFSQLGPVFRSALSKAPNDRPATPSDLVRNLRLAAR